jgi:hypothetical protein
MNGRHLLRMAFTWTINDTNSAMLGSLVVIGEGLTFGHNSLSSSPSEVAFSTRASWPD